MWIYTHRMNTDDNIPWMLIETDYRAGSLSVAEIARAYNVTPTRIHAYAKKNQWARDLTRDVQAKTTHKVLAQFADDDADDDAIIERAADQAASVIKIHRDDVKRSRETCMKILNELEDASSNYTELQQLLTEAAELDEWSYKKIEAANRAVDMGKRAAMMRDLSNALKVLQGLERQAWNLDTKSPQDEDPLTSLLKQISLGSSNALLPTTH